MVATKRRSHPHAASTPEPEATATNTDSRSTPASESAPEPCDEHTTKRPTDTAATEVTADRDERSGPMPGDQTELRTLRDVYDSLVGRTKLRAEIINGRLIVSPIGTPRHQDLAGLLYLSLRWPARERGWKAYQGLDVCMDGSRDPYQPDLVIAPPDAPSWGERELFLSGLVVVGEIVSPSSVLDDWEHKPGVYATGGVPLYIVVDPVAKPATVTVFAEPKEDRYTVSTTVTMGRSIHLPEPLDFTFDTSILLEALPPQ
jgi:Uma2 family endonuclease